MNKNFIEAVDAARRFTWTAIKEIAWGILKNRVPLRLTLFGIVFAVFLLLKLDVDILRLFGFRSHLKFHMRQFLICTWLSSGWILWGVARAAERSRLLLKLQDAFEAAKLKCNGRFPALIKDLEVDEFVRKLCLATNGITKTAFEEAKNQLEASLNVAIGRFIQEEGDKTRIEIYYAHRPLQKSAVLENPEAFGDGEIPIGVAFDRTVTAKFRDVGHMLVAGQTGGGKSNFLKLATSVLTKNNRDARVMFLDFKGGMETADLRNHAENLGPNIECFEGEAKCIEVLAQINSTLEDRFQSISQSGASSLDEYLVKSVSVKPSVNGVMKATDERRTYIVIDEIAQLYSKDPCVSKELRARAQSVVNRISRQGRAAGLHLLLATQKPDARGLDQTVKANLPGILCFPMANQASSVSAIGTKRAYEIDPSIKGRAVWKFGPRLEEVQTYLFH